MLISDKEKLIFIHIPKNAGTSIVSSLSEYSDMSKYNIYVYTKHVAARNIMDIFGLKKWNSYYKFAVIRNPWDWMISLYFYTLKMKDDPRNKIAENLGFKDYVKWFSKENPEKWPALKGQHHYIMDKKYNLLIDEILKFENIEEDYKKLIEKRNLDVNLSKLNSTKHRDFHEYYDEETKEIIKKLFIKDIELFNYKY